MAQIITQNAWWWGGWSTYTAWDGIDISAQNEISVKSDIISWAEAWATAVQPWDLSWYQTTANMVCSLSNADNSHYPSAKAVADALTCAWAWDMLKSVYDPNNKNADAFDYCNFINTPTIPTGIVASITYHASLL